MTSSRSSWPAAVLIGLLVLAVPGAPVRAQSAPDAIADLVAEAGRRFGLPVEWIGAVMRAESGGDRRATSPVGAMGLMQVMPQTWARLRRLYALGADPYDPHDNVIAGAAFLREMYDRYGAPGFLAAYNAGPGRYDAYVQTGRPLPAETRAYVAKLQPIIAGVTGGRSIGDALDPLAWVRSPLFVRVTGDPTRADSVAASDDAFRTQTPVPAAHSLQAGDAASTPRASLFVTGGRDVRPH